MEIAQKSGFTNLLAYCLSPVIGRLFPEYKNDKSITGAISMNITANLLGLGNAATLFGLEAIKLMHKHDKISNTATYTNDKINWDLKRLLFLPIILKVLTGVNFQ